MNKIFLTIFLTATFNLFYAEEGLQINQDVYPFEDKATDTQPNKRYTAHAYIGQGIFHGFRPPAWGPPGPKNTNNTKKHRIQIIGSYQYN